MATVTDKGTQIMDEMLLSQYADSTNLRQYLLAYFEEMDELFAAIEDVYNGRFLENAVGAQLDVIGEILQQSRNINLGTKYFGFLGAPLAEGFGTVSDPTTGGTFKSVSDVGGTVIPLGDAVYRRVLYTKAYLLNKRDTSIETIYHAVCTLLGTVPRGLVISEPANMQVDITASSLDVTLEQELLINLMSKYFLGAGITLTINLVP